MISHYIQSFNSEAWQEAKYYILAQLPWSCTNLLDCYQERRQEETKKWLAISLHLTQEPIAVENLLNFQTDKELLQQIATIEEAKKINSSLPKAGLNSINKIA
jgi:hypothetical protein